MKRRKNSHFGTRTHPPRFLTCATSHRENAAGAALSAKRGQTRKSELKVAAKSMYDSMSEKQLEEFAETDRKNLPKKKTKH